MFTSLDNILIMPLKCGLLIKRLYNIGRRSSWLGIGFLRHRLHGRGFKSKRFHDLETASKTTRFQGVYTEPIQPLNPTVYVKAISFSGLCASSIGAKFDQTRVRRLSSPRPNPESSLAFLFVTLQERIDKKSTFQDIFACISAV